MATPTRTPTHQVLDRLLELRIGQDLAAFVKGRRADGQSWRTISQRLSEITGVEVDYRNLHRWFTSTENES